MYSATTTVAVVFGLALTAQAHMLLNTPARFASQDVPDNGPLNGPGRPSNYPCKYAGPSTYDFNFQRTQLQVGEQQTLSFTGSAVHGGGSCQLSLTKDLAPSASSEFKVIHSIEGGCPARNTPGNLPADPNGNGAGNYTYTIPDGIEPGDYTFAWTWFNKIGNREFYMNCAPITVTAGSKKRNVDDSLSTRDSDFMDSLPNMFLANIPDVPCTTVDSADMKIPNPGANPEINDSTNLAAPLGDVNSCYAPPSKSSPGGAGSNLLGSNQNSPGSPSSAAPSPASSSPAAYSPPAAYTPPALSMTTIVVPPPALSTGLSASSASAPPTPSPSSPAPYSNNSNTQCAEGYVSCPTDGAIVCIGNGFGICNFGCAMQQALASGTQCTGGQIMARGIAVPRYARRSRAIRRHL